MLLTVTECKEYSHIFFAFSKLNSEVKLQIDIALVMVSYEKKKNETSNDD